MTKKVLIPFILSGFLLFCLISFQTLLCQEEQKEQQTEISTEIPKTTSPAYSSRGRRDPFKDLLARQEGEKRATAAAAAAGGPQMTVDNVRLIGIVKLGNEYTAILAGPQEFPLFVKAGHRLSDGFVLSITDSRVVFRKLREGGVPLRKPKDIVKEIIP